MVVADAVFHLQVVTDSILPPDAVADVLIGVLVAGADTVQIRDPAASPAQVATLVDAIERGMPDGRERLVIHEGLDGTGTAGSWRHIRSASIASMPAASAGVDSPFGASVHSIREARRAAKRGAGYVTFGHVYRTRSHPGVPPRGIAALAGIVERVNVPVLAIGGITSDNLDQVLATGCAGVAVISAVISQPDPAAATHRLRGCLDVSPHRPRRPLQIRTKARQEGMP